MSKEDYEDLPTVPYFSKHGHLIPDHLELPPEARAQLPLLYILRKEKMHEPAEEPASGTPWYPQIQWEATPTIDEDQRPNYILSITIKMPPARLDTVEPDPAIGEMPVVCQNQTNVSRTITRTDRNRITRAPPLTKCGLKDLHLAQIRDVHLLALKRLMKDEPLKDAIFPEDVKDFAKR